MGDIFKKVQSGDPLNIPAATYNAFVAAAKAHAGQGPSRTVPKTANVMGSTVPFKNTTSLALPRFSILCIDSPIFTPSENLAEFQNNIAFNGVAPTGNYWHIANFGILDVPLKPDEIGPAVVHGLTPVKVEVLQDEETYQFAGVVTANPARTDALKVQFLNWGARILWRESGLGIKWAIVRLSNPVWYLN